MAQTTPTELPEAAEPPREAFIGKTLKGTYRIEALLARGGMGAVYEARHLRLGRTFAVKVLLDDADDECIAGFRTEAETIARLAHPHIVQVLDVDETENGVPYFVMEHLEGETLATRLRRDGALPILEALLVTFQVASALAQVHARGIIHCDLKPANVFLVRVENERAFAKMLDFGVSRAFHMSNAGSRAGFVIGTPQYMAPEQACGGAIDECVDQFALAALAYEMLSGRAAFSGDDGAEVLESVISADAPSLSKVAPWVPAALDAVLRRAMSKAREDRFSSISRFAWELGNAAMQEGIDPDAGWLPPSVRPGRYRGAGTKIESLFPPPDSPSSDPPTRVEKRRLSEPAESAESSRAEGLLTEAQGCYAAGQLDEAVAKAEKLLELAVYDRDSTALRVLAARIALLDAIFETRVGSLNQCVMSAPLSHAMRVQLSPSAAQLLARVEAPTSVKDLVHQSGMSRRDCMRLLAGLLRRGALVHCRSGPA